MKRQSLLLAPGRYAAVLPFFVAALVWPLGGGKKIQLTAAASVPAAHGVVELGHDGNGNTTIDLHVQHLAHPNSLTPAEMAYVVWIAPNGRPAENKGELHVGRKLECELKTVTPYKSFKIFVTAEGNPQATFPSGQQVLTGNVVE